jgi:hypothetical protein
MRTSRNWRTAMLLDLWTVCRNLYTYLICNWIMMRFAAIRDI